MRQSSTRSPVTGFRWRCRDVLQAPVAPVDLGCYPHGPLHHAADRDVLVDRALACSPLRSLVAWRFGPQRTAFLTSALIVFSSAAVSFVSAKEVGHMLPSSRFAVSLKPNVAYLASNLAAVWKKHTTLPSEA